MTPDVATHLELDAGDSAVASRKRWLEAATETVVPPADPVSVDMAGRGSALLWRDSPHRRLLGIADVTTAVLAAGLVLGASDQRRAAPRSRRWSEPPSSSSSSSFPASTIATTSGECTPRSRRSSGSEASGLGGGGGSSGRGRAASSAGTSSPSQMGQSRRLKCWRRYRGRAPHRSQIQDGKVAA